MSPRIASAVACLIATTAPSPIVGFAFAPPSPSFASTSTSSALSMASSASASSSAQHATEEFYPQLLNSASLCANSETCSVESAELYLKEIVHVQSGCAAGTLSGSNVCNDVLGVSEVVAGLRSKIEKGATKEVRTFWDKRQEELVTLSTASLDNKSAPLKPAYLAIAALYTIAVIAMVQPASMDMSSVGGVVPFTAQEVWWAVRDGYIGDLTSHAFHNGGLLVSDASSAASAAAVGSSSLSPQEVMWSVRDGYASDTLFASGSVGAGGIETTVPFTPQEVLWAIQNGYASDMAEHWFRNGGLSM